MIAAPEPIPTVAASIQAVAAAPTEVTASPAPVPPQASSDAQLLALWLHGRGPATSRAYRADLAGFLAAAGKPLRAITVGNLQTFADSIPNLAPSSRARKLSAIKSLIGYGHRLGYLPFNVGAALRLPPVKGTMAERIIAEPVLHRMLGLETKPRNAALLRLLYCAGLRISEVCSIAWRDVVPRDEAGQVTVYGKGGKTRAVLLPTGMWTLLAQLRGDAEAGAPVFRSQRGGHLDPSAVHRVVKAAAARAGLSAELSAHWLRHAHASHALDRGAPIHLVQATLGHASVATTGRYLHARPNDSSARYLSV